MVCPAPSVVIDRQAQYLRYTNRVSLWNWQYRWESFWWACHLLAGREQRDLISIKFGPCRTLVLSHYTLSWMIRDPTQDTANLLPMSSIHSYFGQCIAILRLMQKNVRTFNVAWVSRALHVSNNDIGKADKVAIPCQNDVIRLIPCGYWLASCLGSLLGSNQTKPLGIHVSVSGRLCIGDSISSTRSAALEYG